MRPHPVSSSAPRRTVSGLGRLAALTAGGVLTLRVMLSAAWAAQLIQIQPLDFGTVTLLDSSTVGTVALAPDGTYVASPQIAMTSPPTPARFEATDFPPNTAGSVSVTDGTVTEGGNGTGQTFSISSYVIDPAVAVTDGNGDFTFDLGATLSTEGDGNAYPSGAYTGTITVTVTF